MAGCYPADNTHRHGVISDSRSLESFRQKQFPQRNTVSRLSDWLRGLVTPTLTYPMMHSRLCLIGSLSDSNDNEAECFLQDIVCFHVFGVNEFWITWSDDETFNQFEFFSAWICFFFLLNLQLDVFLFFVSVLLTELKTFRQQTSDVLTEFIECVCYQLPGLQLVQTLTLIKLYFLLTTSLRAVR